MHPSVIDWIYWELMDNPKRVPQEETAQQTQRGERSSSPSWKSPALLPLHEDRYWGGIELVVILFLELFNRYSDCGDEFIKGVPCYTLLAQLRLVSLVATATDSNSRSRWWSARKVIETLWSGNHLWNVDRQSMLDSCWCCGHCSYQVTFAWPSQSLPLVLCWLWLDWRDWRNFSMHIPCNHKSNHGPVGLMKCRATQLVGLCPSSEAQWQTDIDSLSCSAGWLCLCVWSEMAGPSDNNNFPELNPPFSGRHGIAIK